MFHKIQLPTVIAIVLSAGGTISSAYAGGFGGFGGGSGGGSHHHSSGHSHSSSGFKMNGNSSNSAPRILQSNNNSSNLGNKVTLPKNTGIVPRIGGTSSGNSGNKLPGNTGIAGGIKLPGVGTIGQSHSNHSNSSNKSKTTTIGNIVGNSNKGGSNTQKILGGIGIGIGLGNGNGGNGPGKGNGNCNHNHHHHCPPLIFTLPVCQSNYCPPPCPPIIYYPVPVAVPVADPNALPVDPNAIPAPPADPNAAPPAGLPTEAKAALKDIVAETKVDEQVQPAAAETTELVSKEVALPQIPVGATLTLQGKDLSDKEGQVVLQLGDIALPATIQEWKNDAVTCTLPVLGLTKASKATIHVLKSDGKTASTLNCELVTTLPTSVEAKPATTKDIEAAKYEQ